MGGACMQELRVDIPNGVLLIFSAATHQCIVGIVLRLPVVKHRLGLENIPTFTTAFPLNRPSINRQCSGMNESQDTLLILAPRLADGGCDPRIERIEQDFRPQEMHVVPVVTFQSLFHSRWNIASAFFGLS